MTKSGELVKILTMKRKRKRLDAEAVEKREIAADIRAYRAATKRDQGKPVHTIEEVRKRLGI